MERERDEARPCGRGDILGAKEGVGDRDEPTTGKKRRWRARVRGRWKMSSGDMQRGEGKGGDEGDNREEKKVKKEEREEVVDRDQEN